MTTEDVPETMTPVAGALQELLRSAVPLHHRLSAIAKMSSELQGEAAIQGRARLGIPSPDEEAKLASEAAQEKSLVEEQVNEDAKLASEAAQEKLLVEEQVK